MSDTCPDRGIRIVTDSAADIPLALAQAWDIAIVPLTVAFGSDIYQDTALTSERFWRLVQEADGPPMTSQPSPEAFSRTFGDLVEKGCRVLCMTLTAAHSGTYSAAWTAARTYGDRVTVFDSRSLSIGQGFQVLRAAQWVRDGLGMGEIVERLQSLRERIHIVIQFESVEFLRRGGRAAALMPAIDRLLRALSLRPLLVILEGELRLLGVARSRRKAFQRIEEHIGRLGALECVAVMHTRGAEAAEELAAALCRLTGMAREEMWLDEAGAVLASHGGSGILGAMGVTQDLLALG